MDNYIALAIVAHACIGQIVGPTVAKNILGWVVGILALILILKHLLHGGL